MVSINALTRRAEAVLTCRQATQPCVGMRATVGKTTQGQQLWQHSVAGLWHKVVNWPGCIRCSWKIFSQARQRGTGECTDMTWRGVMNLWQANLMCPAAHFCKLTIGVGYKWQETITLLPQPAFWGPKKLVLCCCSNSDVQLMKPPPSNTPCLRQPERLHLDRPGLLNFPGLANFCSCQLPDDANYSCCANQM